MTDNEGPMKRLGVARIGKFDWEGHADAILDCLGRSNVMSHEQSIGPAGNYVHSVDVFLEHPDFDLIDTGDPKVTIPIYTASFTKHDDGTVTLAGFSRLDPNRDVNND